VDFSDLGVVSGCGCGMGKKLEEKGRGLLVYFSS